MQGKDREVGREEKRKVCGGRNRQEAVERCEEERQNWGVGDIYVEIVNARKQHEAQVFEDIY